MILLQQSVASQEIPLGIFVDSTDGNTEESGLTIANTDIKLWKTGATTLASKNSGGATYISNGIYYAVLDATDTNTLGPLVIFVHVAGALAVKLECLVVTASAYAFLTAVTGDAFARLGAPVGASISADIAGVQADTDNIQTRIPAALVSGRIDASVGAMAANVMTAAAAAADLTTELQTGLATAAALATTDGKVDAIDTVVDAILVDTAEIGAAGAGLTALASQASVNTIDDFLDTEVAALTTAVADIPTNAELATALAAADDVILAAVAALNNLSAAEVNAQVVDVLATDTYAEPGAVPASTATLAAKIGWLFALARNKATQDATTLTLRNDADNADIATSTVSDDGTTTVRGEWA